MIYKSIDLLESSFKKKVEKFLEICKNEKIPIFITETYRNALRQQELIKKGLSKIKRSLHQDRIAFDIAFNKPYTLYPENDMIWNKVYDIAEKCGIDCGYRLWGWDRPHFQNNGKKCKLTQNYMDNINIIELQIQQNSEAWKQWDIIKKQSEKEQTRLAEMNIKNRKVLESLKK